MHWRRKWPPTPVFLPGESHGQRSLVGYNLWGCKVRHDWATNTHTQVVHSFSSKEQASFNSMTAVTTCNDFGAQENKVCHCFHCLPIYLPWSDGADVMILVFWVLSFTPTFSLSSFTFIKRLFSSSSLSAISEVKWSHSVMSNSLWL